MTAGPGIITSVRRLLLSALVLLAAGCGSGDHPSLRAARPPGRSHRGDWSSQVVSLAICGGAGSVRLVHGSAVLGGPVGEATVHDISLGQVSYADVTGDHVDEAFLPLWCTNGGGNADGQMAEGFEVYTTGSVHPRLLGVLRPTQPASNVHVPYFDESTLVVRGTQVELVELWYADTDGTCCPSLQVSSVWRYMRGKFEHVSSTRPQQVAN